MSGLKDLAPLLNHVPPEEPINIEIQPDKWAVPFKGMWVGIHHSKVPALQPLTSMKLMEGSVLVFFEDGTCLDICYVSCVKQSLQGIKDWGWNYNGDFDPIKAFNPWIEGLDYPKYQSIKAAQEKVAAAKAEYQSLMKSLGKFEEVGTDYQYVYNLKWNIPGVPNVFEWV